MPFFDILLPWARSTYAFQLLNACLDGCTVILEKSIYINKYYRSTDASLCSTKEPSEMKTMRVLCPHKATAIVPCRNMNAVDQR